MKLSIKSFKDNKNNYYNFKRKIENARAELGAALLYTPAGNNGVLEKFIVKSINKLHEVEFEDGFFDN